MRYAKIVSLAIFSALAVAAAAPVALAARDIEHLGLLRPRGQWQIGTVDAQGGDMPYCALMGEFSKGAVLAFSRKTDGDNSVAVDFHGDFFQAEKAYEVTLQIDDAKPRSLSGRASGSGSVVVQMEPDDKFYAALNQARKLKVATVRVDASFSLQSFSDSYTSMLGCVRGLQPSVGPKTAAAPVIDVEKALLPSEGKDAAREAFIQRMQGLQKDNEALRAQLADEAKKQVQKYGELARVLSGPWADYEDKMKAVVTERDAAKKKLAAATEESQRIADSLVTTQKDRHALETRLASIEQQKQDAAMRLVAQEKQVKALQSVLAALKASAAADKRKLADVQTELDILRTRHASIVAELQEEIRNKATQYDDLKAAYESQSGVLSEVSRQAIQAEEALNTAMRSHSVTVPVREEATAGSAPLRFNLPSSGAEAVSQPYEPDTVLIQ